MDAHGSVDGQRSSGLVPLVLFASSLTVLAGAVIAPALPRIEAHFAGLPGAEAEHVALQARLLLTLHGLAIACSGALAGWCVDRFGRRGPLALGALLYALCGSAGLWADALSPLLFSRLGLGLGVALVMTSATAIIGDRFQSADRGRFLGWQATAMALGGICYLITGGLLAGLSWRGPFAIYLVALPLVLLVWPLVPPRLQQRHDGDREGATPDTPWGGIAGVMLLAFIGMSGFYLIPVQIPARVELHYGLPPVAAALVIGGNTVVSAGASLAYGRLAARYAPAVLGGAGLLLMGLGHLLSASVDALAVLVAGVALHGLGMGLIMPNHMAWAARLAPIGSRGRALGGVTAALFLGQFASPILAEPLRRASGFTGLFATGGGLLVVVGTLLLIWRPGLAGSDRGPG